MKAPLSKRAKEMIKAGVPIMKAILERKYLCSHNGQILRICPVIRKNWTG